MKTICVNSLPFNGRKAALLQIHKFAAGITSFILNKTKLKCQELFSLSSTVVFVELLDGFFLSI